MTRIRITALLLVLSIIFGSASALAEGGALSFEETPAEIRPGKTVRIVFNSPAAAETALRVEDSQGQEVGLAGSMEAAQGRNELYWDGELLEGEGGMLPEGEYTLSLVQGENRVSAPIKAGPLSPRLTDVKPSDPALTAGDEEWAFSAVANMAGTLHLNMRGADGAVRNILSAPVPAGSLLIPWDGSMVDGQPDPTGAVTVSLTLEGPDGFMSSPHHLVVTIEGGNADPAKSETNATDEGALAQEGDALEGPIENAETPAPEEALPQGEQAKDGGTAPHYKIPTAEKVPVEQWGGNYWTLPIGEWNEERIWKTLMQPITVVEGGDQRETYKLRKTPDKNSSRENVVGEITFVSHGVNVLETLENGWSLVETYNSSYGPKNRTRRGYGDTDELMRGYVETRLLSTVKPRDDYGILIDKLKQEMYVFKDGKLLTTLIISTGKPTKQQPWNETPSGEYLMVSRVGDFNAGNLVCKMGMRINGGTLIHEVPYIQNLTTGYADYSSQERVLGEKASHGCVRVQRKNNDDGINMTWLWNNIKVNTKVLVWDDTNRYRELPDDNLALYYNPTGGKYYHLDARCPSVRDRYLPLKGELTYAQLDDPEFSKLTRCPHCNPPQRKSEIMELNRQNGF